MREAVVRFRIASDHVRLCCGVNVAIFTFDEDRACLLDHA